MNPQRLSTAAGGRVATMTMPARPHILVDLYGCKPDRLDDRAGIERLLLEAAAMLGATVVGRVFHQFSPHGVTGILAIAESHLSAHTWVEDGYAAIDLFMCNSNLTSEQIEAAIRRIAAFFGARGQIVSALQRGLEAPVPPPEPGGGSH